MNEFADSIRRNVCVCGGGSVFFQTFTLSICALPMHFVKFIFTTTAYSCSACCLFSAGTTAPINHCRRYVPIHGMNLNRGAKRKLWREWNIFLVIHMITKTEISTVDFNLTMLYKIFNRIHDIFYIITNM